MSPAQGDSAEGLSSSRAASAQGWEMPQCPLPTPHHPSPLIPHFPKGCGWLCSQPGKGGTPGRGGEHLGGASALTELRGCQELNASPFPPFVPSQGSSSWGQQWPRDTQRTAGDKGGGRAEGWRPGDRQSQPGRPGVTIQEMPVAIPASNSCLGNSESLLSSAADPKRLPPLLAALASPAGAGGSGPALVIMARLWDETERGREAPRL